MDELVPAIVDGGHGGPPPPPPPPPPPRHVDGGHGGPPPVGEGGPEAPPPVGDGGPLAPAGDGGPPPPPLMVPPAGPPPVGDRGPRPPPPPVPLGPPPPPVVPAPPVIPPPIIPPPAVPAPLLPPAAHVAALQHHRQQVLRQLRALNREIVRFDYNNSVRLIIYLFFILSILTFQELQGAVDVVGAEGQLMSLKTIAFTRFLFYLKDTVHYNHYLKSELFCGTKGQNTKYNQ